MAANLLKKREADLAIGELMQIGDVGPHELAIVFSHQLRLKGFMRTL